MLDGTYDLLINTPRGDKQGEATLKTKGSVLSVDVKVAGYPRQRGKGTVNGDSFMAEGTVKILVLGPYDYRLEGAVKEDLLEATCYTPKGVLCIAGVRR